MDLKESRNDLLQPSGSSSLRLSLWSAALSGYFLISPLIVSCLAHSGHGPYSPGISAPRRNIVDLSLHDSYIVWTPLHYRALVKKKGKRYTRHFRMNVRARSPEKAPERPVRLFGSFSVFNPHIVPINLKRKRVLTVEFDYVVEPKVDIDHQTIELVSSKWKVIGVVFLTVQVVP